MSPHIYFQKHLSKVKKKKILPKYLLCRQSLGNLFYKESSQCHVSCRLLWKNLLFSCKKKSKLEKLALFIYWITIFFVWLTSEHGVHLRCLRSYISNEIGDLQDVSHVCTCGWLFWGDWTKLYKFRALPDPLASPIQSRIHWLDSEVPIFWGSSIFFWISMDVFQ